MKEYCGWYYTQGIRRDTFGNEIQKKLCLTDNDISSGDYTVNEIEFVHKLVINGIQLDIDTLDTL